MTSETPLQQQLRLTAPKHNAALWRNNNGACRTDDGRYLRFGLGNDSQQVNRKYKSSDLIGVRALLITQEMVGMTIGQFMAVEVKHPAWSFPNETNKSEFARCNAQRNFGNKVISYGGAFTFANKLEDVFT